MVTKTELFRFSEQGSGLIWNYTSGREEITYLAEDYVPTLISRTEVTIKSELSKANLEITLPLTNEAGLRWLADNGERIVTLTIYERDKLGAFIVVWKGRLAGVTPGMNSIKLRMESIFTSLRRYGLRAKYQRNCRHALYGRGCNLDPEDFAVAGTVSANLNASFTIAEAALQADGYYTGGMLRAPDDTLSYITAHVGETITVQRLSFALLDAIDGGFPFNVTLYPGCDHTLETCWGKFDNGLNCGCFRFIPTKNPMGGSSIV